MGEEPKGRQCKALATHLELGAPAAGGHDCVLPWPAPGPLASLPVLHLLLMFPGDTAPISFEKPSLQTLLWLQPPPSTPKRSPLFQSAVAYHRPSVLQQSQLRCGQGSRHQLGVGWGCLCSQPISTAIWLKWSPRRERKAGKRLSLFFSSIKKTFRG